MKKKSEKKERFSYTIVPNYIFDRMKFDSPFERLVYLCLYRYKDERGYCFPSLDTISERCSCSRNTASRVINAMKKKKYIAVHVRFNASNIFQILPVTEEMLMPIKKRNYPPFDLSPVSIEVTPVREEVISHGEECHPSQVNYNYLSTNTNLQLPAYNPVGWKEGIFMENEEREISGKRPISGRKEDTDTPEKFKMRKKLVESILELITRATEKTPFLVENSMRFNGFSNADLELIYENIKKSPFLMGKLKSKPTLWNFAKPVNLYKIMGGVFEPKGSISEDRSGEKFSEHPYHHEFQKKEEKLYEPTEF